MSSSSSSAASMGALAAATAMALSGSLVLFSLRRFAKPALDGDVDAAAASDEPASSLRPCLSSSEKRPRGGKKPGRKGEKRVRFAEGVVDNEGAAPAARSSSSTVSPAPEPTCRGSAVETTDHRMPANREALYRGMLRDRSVHRTAYSY
uniref:Uncharacterized protein n=1 Tax=Avena sativa TaxID=4498 RepID=A0ACD5YPL0_AVESA